VYPPVDTEFFTPASSSVGSANGSRYALVVSALVPYKRVDVAIEACRLAHVRLTIAGDGPERGRLERIASGGSTGSDVTFLGRQSDDALRDLYRGAAVTLLPGEEDFGIVPVEAQACGCPVVALGRGGALETVVANETGLLVDAASAQAFADAIARAMDMDRAGRFDKPAIRRHAERFSRERFCHEMAALIESDAQFSS
jgi:glycosyltransferase involved in cell wall biosynthesis